MSEKTKWVSFWPSDWRGGCASLTPQEEWVYLQLCMVIWEGEDSIHEDEFARHMMRHPGDWKADLATLVKLKKVHRSQGRLLTVLRAQRENERARKKRDTKAARAAAAEARAKREGKEKPERTSREPRENLERTSRENEKNQANSKDLPILQRGEPEPEPEPEPDSTTGNSGEAEKMPRPSDDIWQQFCEFRMTRGSPIIGNTQFMVLADLERIWKSHRQHPDDIIRQSLDKQWSSLRPLRPDERKSGWHLDD